MSKGTGISESAVPALDVVKHRRERKPERFGSARACRRGAVTQMQVCCRLHLCRRQPDLTITRVRPGEDYCVHRLQLISMTLCLLFKAVLLRVIHAFLSCHFHPWPFHFFTKLASQLAYFQPSVYNGGIEDVMLRSCFLLVTRPESCVWDTGLVFWILMPSASTDYVSAELPSHEIGC